MPKKIASGKTRAKGSARTLPRHGMSSNFLKVLNEDFEAYGRDVIASMRVNEPAAYLRLAASILPKEPVIKRPAEELSDEALHNLIEANKRSEVEVPVSEKRNRSRVKPIKIVG